MKGKPFIPKPLRHPEISDHLRNMHGCPHFGRGAEHHHEHHGKMKAHGRHTHDDVLVEVVKTVMGV